MNRLLFCIICSLFSAACFAQVVQQGGKFTEVPVIEQKVVFMKEIPSKQGVSMEANFKVLKEWAREKYARDPFISSVRYDAKNNEFIAKSRIELLLPPNAQGEREKMIMRYRVNGFLFQGKCVLEITEIAYLYENQNKNISLPKIIRAEDFITDKAIGIRDTLQELRTNTRKSTLFFLNELGKEFDGLFGN